MSNSVFLSACESPPLSVQNHSAWVASKSAICARAASMRAGVLTRSDIVWSAPAERSGDGALDYLSTVGAYSFLPFSRRFIFVVHSYVIQLKTVYRLNLSWSSSTLKPSCGAPGVFIRHCH